jgi:DNA-binding beta-propeller fold protein YncE
LQTIAGGPFARLKSPGSVSATRIDNGGYDILVCDNDSNRVTRHVLDGKAPFRVKRNRVLLGRKLRIPDGIAASRDGHWIAVSSHDKHEVLLYEDMPNLNRRTRATGKLHTITYPHGLRFTPDDKYILVADAGMPFVHIFAHGGSGWRGDHHPVGSIRVMDDETYFRGRLNPRDGGPKGIDIDRNMQVLAVTNETQPLAFFDLPAILAQPKLAWGTAAAA